MKHQNSTLEVGIYEVYEDGGHSHGEGGDDDDVDVLDVLHYRQVPPVELALLQAPDPGGVVEVAGDEDGEQEEGVEAEPVEEGEPPAPGGPWTGLQVGQPQHALQGGLQPLVEAAPLPSDGGRGEALEYHHQHPHVQAQ